MKKFVQFLLILRTDRRYGIPPAINADRALIDRVEASVSTLNRLLEEGQIIYGIHA